MRAIKNISVISTGSVQIRPQHAESDGTPMIWWLGTSRQWGPSRPINVYVIEHTDGLVLFDTGQDRSSVTDPKYFPGGVAGQIYRRLARFSIPRESTLTAQLAAIGYDIADVRIAILSHLHQDHIGGLPELGHATIVVSAVELAQADKRAANYLGYLKNHIRLPGLDWRPVTPDPTDDESIAPFTSAHDLLGDGTLLLVPTPGHTPGSLSLLVRQGGMPPLLFVGDLTYDLALLWAERIPGVGDTRGLAASTRLVVELKRRHPDLVVLAAHDPAAESLLRAALTRGAAAA